MFVSIAFHISDDYSKLEAKDSLGQKALITLPPDLGIPENKSNIQWWLDRIDERKELTESWKALPENWKAGYMSISDWSGMRFTFPG